MLHQLGEVSGRWTAWVEKDNIPRIPTVRPEPPIKPSSEGLMNAIKAEMRQARIEAALKDNPGIEISTIPTPSDLEIWRDYERMKGVYQDQQREFEWREKLARETYPDENRKVFSSLIDCISESSVQDLKRSPEGAKLFDEHDSYGFLKLAIKEHEYLPPAISSAAVAKAKDDFESLRQKAEDTVTDHVNEFKRRHEVLIKARGSASVSPYADYDLRDLLVRSLYVPAWGACLAYRDANDNMPATFDELVLALKKAEAKRILRSSTAIDIYMPSAHATKYERTDSPTPGGPTKCEQCGSIFCPKRSTHVRCDTCQAAYVAQRKKERQKDKSSKKRKEGKRKEKKAHATTADKDNEESSEEEDQVSEGELDHRTSFSCICSTRACSVAESVIYLDNCSNLNVIRDRALALEIKKEKTVTRISGSIPGSLTSQVSAEIGDMGRGCYDPAFSRNLISEDAAIRAGYRITRDSGIDNCYYLSKPGRAPLVFTCNEEGTFSISASRFRKHFAELYATSNSTDVDRTTVVFTKRQRERAERYHFDHHHCLNHLHHDRVILALRKGLLTNVPYTEADIRNALVIYGPCGICNKFKGVRHRQIGHYPQMPEAPGERLAGDLFSIMGILFSVISCRLIKLKCVTRLQNKGASEILRAVRDCVNVWKGFGAKPKTLSWDQEPSLIHTAAEIWATLSLRIEPTPPDAHERLAEREVRTIKEHVYAVIMGLGHAVDEDMIEGIVRDTVTLLNFTPNSETVDGSPRTYLDGERLDYSRWSRVHAGQVAEFEIPYPAKQGGGARKELGYVLCHQGDNPVVRLLPSGRKTVIRSGHITVIEKSTAIKKMIEDGITGAKRQKFNDLLAEMDEFYSYNQEPEASEESNHEQLRHHVARQESVRDEEPVHSLAEQRILEHTPTDEITNQEMPSQPQPVITQPTESESHTPMVEDQLQSIHSEEITAYSPIPLEASKNTLRRSTREGARKPEGFYSKLNAGESVADYTACHLRSSECEKLYGAEPTKEAGIAEVVNMIKDRGAALPRDYRKLSKKVVEEALPSFMFFKAKDLLPSEQHSDNKGSTPEEWQLVESNRARKLKKQISLVKIRGRWVGGGNHQQKGEVLAERVAPTARGASHSLIMTIAASEGRKLLVGDIPSAYLQADHVPANGRRVYIVADKFTTALIVEAMPEYKDFVRPNGTMILEVAKAMYGLVESAWLWYKEFERHMIGLGYSVSTNDRGLFYKRTFVDGKCVASNLVSVHVDDIALAASPNAEGKRLEEELWSSMESRWPGIKMQKGPHYRHLSWNIYQDPKTYEIRKSQRDYLLEVVKTCGVVKEHKLPSRADLVDSDDKSPILSEAAIKEFRSILQKIAYAREGRPDIDFTVSFLQRKQSAPTMQDQEDLYHLLGYIKKYPEREIVFKPKDLQLRGYADASFNLTTDGRSYYGYIITLGHAMIVSKGGRIKTSSLIN